MNKEELTIKNAEELENFAKESDVETSKMIKY